MLTATVSSATHPHKVPHRSRFLERTYFLRCQWRWVRPYCCAVTREPRWPDADHRSEGSRLGSEVMPRWVVVVIVAPLALCVVCASLGYFVVVPKIRTSITESQSAVADEMAAA